MAGSSQNDNRTYGTYIHTFPSSLLIEGNGMQTLNDALTVIYPNGASAVNNGSAVTVIVTNAASSEPENLKELIQDNGTLKKD